ASSASVDRRGAPSSRPGASTPTRSSHRGVETMTDGDRLAGKVVLVTGTSRNIGGVAASGFAAAGARVACNDIRAERAENSAAAIRAAGGEAMAVPGDVTDPDQMGAAVAAVLDAWDVIDVLMSNAVRFDARGLLTMAVEDYRRQ